MYVNDEGAEPAPPQVMAAGQGWAVAPEQVREFADTVAQVYADLQAVRREVAEFQDPALAPKLGTSPPARELADKFNDRIAGEDGLAGQLEVALANLQEFVDGAMRTAAKYTEVDHVTGTGFRAQ